MEDKFKDIYATLAANLHEIYKWITGDSEDWVNDTIVGSLPGLKDLQSEEFRTIVVVYCCVVGLLVVQLVTYKLLCSGCTWIKGKRNSGQVKGETETVIGQNKKSQLPVVSSKGKNETKKRRSVKLSSNNNANKIEEIELEKEDNEKVHRKPFGGLIETPKSSKVTYTVKNTSGSSKKEQDGVEKATRKKLLEPFNAEEKTNKNDVTNDNIMELSSGETSESGESEGYSLDDIEDVTKVSEDEDFELDDEGYTRLRVESLAVAAVIKTIGDEAQEDEVNDSQQTVMKPSRIVSKYGNSTPKVTTYSTIDGSLSPSSKLRTDLPGVRINIGTKSKNDESKSILDTPDPRQGKFRYVNGDAPSLDTSFTGIPRFNTIPERTKLSEGRGNEGRGCQSLIPKPKSHRKLDD